MAKNFKDRSWLGARMAMLLAATLLGGCTAVTMVTSLRDSEAIEPGEGAGLVIVGFSYSGEPSTFPLRPKCPIQPIAIPTAVPPRSVEIGRFDEAGKIRPLDSIWALHGNCSKVTPDEPVKYNFLHLPAATYAIQGIRSLDLMNRSRLLDPPAFTVKAGDVIYVGDVVIDSLYPRSIIISRTPDAAKAALAKRNGPIDRFVNFSTSGSTVYSVVH